MDFAEELRLFRERCGGTTFDGLVIPGTLQATTAALLIGALAPRRVAFLLTPDSREMPDQVARKLGLDIALQNWQRYDEDHTDPLQIYRSLRKIIEAWNDLPRERLAVDVTGGTKPMSIGLAKAAYVLNLPALYVESEYVSAGDGTERKVPRPGSQYLAPPPDPYVVFGDLEAAEAARLYEAHDYANAARIFADLGRRVPPPDGPQYAALATLAAAYSAWEVFDLKTARDRLEEFLSSVPEERELFATIATQVQTLERLEHVARQAAGRGREALATLADPDAVLALLGSLYASAKRREAQGRYDTAALLLYRCLELISQHRLATWDVSSERPDFTAARERVPDLEPRYRDVQRAQGRRRPYPLPDRAFGLFVGYMLLAALDDPLVREYDIGRIEARSDARNTSILAHGYRLITRDEYHQFAEVVEELLARLLALLGRDRDVWEQTSRFVALP
ncbi:MAG: TIGR02710 family CRISPR-associated CARF protein [Chloroflexaceae bacterium]